MFCRGSSELDWLVSGFEKKDKKQRHRDIGTLLYAVALHKFRHQFTTAHRRSKAELHGELDVLAGEVAVDRWTSLFCDRMGNSFSVPTARMAKLDNYLVVLFLHLKAFRLHVRDMMSTFKKTQDVVVKQLKAIGCTVKVEGEGEDKAMVGVLSGPLKIVATERKRAVKSKIPGNLYIVPVPQPDASSKRKRDD